MFCVIKISILAFPLSFPCVFRNSEVGNAFGHKLL